MLTLIARKGVGRLEIMDRAEIIKCQPVSLGNNRSPLPCCPYCGGDLNSYRRELRIRSDKSAIHRGVQIGFIRQKGEGLGFRLNGWRYVDKRGFLTLELAQQAAVAMIDELLDSAKVQTLED